MGKKNFKMTPEERATHDAAVKLRKLPDKELVKACSAGEAHERIEMLLAGLSAGEVKGIKGGTAYKIMEYARERGLIA